MSDRFNGLVVILDRDLRSDDAEATIAAIKQLRYVADVQPHVTSLEDQIAYGRVRDELRSKIWKAFHGEAEL